MSAGVGLAPMKPLRPLLALLLFALMAGASLLAHWLQPSELQRRAQPGTGFVLEEAIPKAFGSWRLVPTTVNVVTNPEVQEILDRVYSQILSRTYVNNAGYRIMLSMAYGEDQRGGLQAHRPEVCYPAQGFALLSNEAAQVTTVLGPIAARRLVTRLGTRNEPITYWFNVGDRPIAGRLERRMEEIRLVMTGAVPDGLLFRVSSVDADAQRAFDEQQRFVSDLLAALPAPARKKIGGL
jgi:EpsI family protein